MIIVCHGAGANLADYKSTEIKEFSQSYWVSMGYAIMDMYACPPELANGSELHYGNPVVLECYEKGYQYVLEHYNLKTDAYTDCFLDAYGRENFEYDMLRVIAAFELFG